MIVRPYFIDEIIIIKATKHFDSSLLLKIYESNRYS